MIKKILIGVVLLTAIMLAQHTPQTKHLGISIGDHKSKMIYVIDRQPDSMVTLKKNYKIYLYHNRNLNDKADLSRLAFHCVNDTIYYIRLTFFYYGFNDRSREDYDQFIDMYFDKYGLDKEKDYLGDNGKRRFYRNNTTTAAEFYSQDPPGMMIYDIENGNRYGTDEYTAIFYVNMSEVYIEFRNTVMADYMERILR